MRPGAVFAIFGVMAPNVINLRKLRKELRGSSDPVEELPAPPEEKLIETEEAAHPDGFPEGEGPYAVLLAWEALEFEPDAGQSVLQITLGALLLIGAAVAIIFRSYLLGLFLVIAAGLVASYAFRKPRSLSLAITGRGVKIENRIYEFRELKSFRIAYDPPLSRDLILESKKTFVPTIRIPLGDADPLRIRETLLRFLPEVEREDSLLDIISKRLGF